MKREFLMLAHKLDFAKFCVGGAYYSEKLDGKRAFWDGGVTRGIPKSEVPWANHAKDERYIDPPIATGLWSRYGNVIHAPDWWLDALPVMPLDGELYPNVADHTKEHRQDLMSKISKLVPVDSEWAEVALHAYGIPNYAEVFREGQVRNPNYEHLFTIQDEVWMLRAVDDFDKDWDYWPKSHKRLSFEQEEYLLIGKLANCNPKIVKTHEQCLLPYSTFDAIAVLEQKLLDVVAEGGEGLIVRAGIPHWQPTRSHHMLKLKPCDDAEGIVVGYTTGRETNRGSKLLGMMGALILEIEGGKRLELSGFTDEERRLHAIKQVPTPFTDGCGLQEFDPPTPFAAFDWASEHPGEEVPDWIEAIKFPRGTVVTFKYRGKSKDGIPQEARYDRVRHNT